jgi:hypothetical protein
MPVDRMMKKASTPHQAWGGAKSARAFYAAEKQDRKKDGRAGGRKKMRG